MKIQTTSDLECPNILNKRRCHGELHAEALTQKQDEILDGFLLCRKCKIRHPIIRGIPILVGDLKQYLKNNFRGIKEIIGSHSKIHKEIFLYILALTRSLFKKDEDQTLFGPGHIQGEGSGYFLLHYGNLYKTAHTPLLNDLIRLHKENNAYEIFKRWLSKKELKDTKAVDVGCNTGGMTYLLAGDCSFSYGVDISYANLFNASRVTKHIPSRLDEYKVNERGKLRIQKINIKGVDNIDFLLASADNLPFKDRIFDISLSSSVLDIARNNVKILKEAHRTLKKEGEIFLSFVPLFSRLKEGKRELSLTAENIKRCARDIRFYQEFKNIPFILRHSENFYNVYDNYCMIGKRIR